MKISYIDCTPYGHSILLKNDLLSQLPDLNLYVGTPNEDELDSLLHDTVGLINGRTIIDKEFLDRCNALKVIVFLGTGASTYIDLEETEKRGIEVLTVRGYGDRTIAEHTFALMLAASRQIAVMDRDLRQGIWEPKVGLEIYGKRLGVIGVGGIGEELITMASAFGMEVVAWNRSAIDENLPCSTMTLCELISSSDIISLHLALNEETRGIIGAKELSQMKSSAILINASRGALVDEEALIEALQNEEISHAALDVFEQEPLRKDHVLTSLDNVTLTSHSAFTSDEAMARLLGGGIEQMILGINNLNEQVEK